MPRKLLSRFANQLDFSEGHKLLSGEEWVGVCGRVRGRGQRGQKPQSRESIWRTKGKGCVSLCPHGSQARVCHVLSYSQRAQLTEGAEAVVQIPSGLTMAWRPGVGRKAGWLVSCALQRSRHFGAQAQAEEAGMTCRNGWDSPSAPLRPCLWRSDTTPQDPVLSLPVP